MICAVIAIQINEKWGFAGHAEKSFKSWANGIYVYTGLDWSRRYSVRSMM